MNKFEPTGEVKWPTLVADNVDLPARAATCHPDPLMKRCGSSILPDLDTVFPMVEASKHEIRPAVSPQSCREYLKLIAREIQCGKLHFRRHVKAIRDTFVAPKVSRGRLREIWNGSSASQVA